METTYFNIKNTKTQQIQNLQNSDTFRIGLHAQG